jgi:hypothetical protein
LAGVSGTTVDAKRGPVAIVEIDEVLKRLIDEEYIQNPFLRQPQDGGTPVSL